MTTKLTVNLPNETAESIKWLAEDNHTTMTESFRLAIERQKFLEQEMAKGNKLLIASPGFPLNIFKPEWIIREVKFNQPLTPSV